MTPPPGVSIRHGPVLHLLHGPKPSFERTGLGEFDTGQRVFRCLAANAQAYLNRYFNIGTRDRDLLRFCTGRNTDVLGYPDMLVTGATIEYIGGDAANITARFAGVMGYKKGAVIPSCGSESRSYRAFNDSAAVGGRISTKLPVPTVVHIFTTNRGKPNQFAVGGDFIPPGVTTQELEELVDQYADPYIPPQNILSQKWVRSSRVPRSPGNVSPSNVWRCEDTYTFERITVDAVS